MRELNNGHVVQRFDKKGKTVIITPISRQFCQVCGKDLKGVKSLAHSMGNQPMGRECFECFEEFNE